MTSLVESPLPSHLGAAPGGECQCGRGNAIGTCHWSDGRLWFRAFHDGPTVYHLENAADWACVDCVADAAVAVASGEVRERMRQWAREHRAAISGEGGAR